MKVVNPRDALRRLAPCVTVGIGGVPDRELAFAFDVPTLPELVSQGESLRGARPSSWRWFVDALQRRGATIAKVQVPGPASGLRDARAQAVSYVRELADAGVQSIVFIDEPMLSAGASLHDVLALRDAIRDAGAAVGLHCCGNTDWPRVLDADFDVVSLDARLSLDALVEDRAAWRRFVSSGAWLALGIVPTGGAHFDLDELCESVEATLRAVDAFPVMLERVMLSPACGLGLRDATAAEHALEHLRRAQTLLRPR